MWPRSPRSRSSGGSRRWGQGPRATTSSRSSPRAATRLSTSVGGSSTATAGRSCSSARTADHDADEPPGSGLVRDDDGDVGPGPQVEGDAVDLTILRVPSGDCGQPPRSVEPLDPAGERPTFREHGIEQAERRRRQAQEAFASRKPDRGSTEHRAERGVAVHDDVAVTRGDPGGAPRRTVHRGARSTMAGSGAVHGRMMRPSELVRQLRPLDGGYGPVKGLKIWLKPQVGWAIPEQSFAPPTPGQFPLSRWIAHIDRTAIPFDWAKASRDCASASVVTSVRLG